MRKWLIGWLLRTAFRLHQGGANALIRKSYIGGKRKISIEDYEYENLRRKAERAA